jgi:hypothetical protein
VHLINKIGFLGLLVFLALACKKESVDSIEPTLEIISPTYLSSYFSVDTILIHATMFDDQMVRSVNVRLISASGQVYGTIPEITPMVKEYDYSQLLILDRPDMIQGQYFLEVAVSDGFNIKKEYKEILIISIPLVLNATYVSAGSINTQGIFEIVDGGATNVFSNAEDVISLHANYFEDEVMVATGIDGRIRSYEFPDYDLKWVYNIENNNPSRSITCTSFDQASEAFLLGDSDGFARVLNNTGDVILGFQSNQTLYRPVKAILTANEIYFVERRLDGSDQNFNRYFRSSGALDVRLYLEGSVLSMFEDHSTQFTENADEVILFINKDDGPELRVFHQLEEGFSVPINLPSGNLLSVCKIGRERYVFQIDNTIYYYGFSGQLQIYLQNAEPFSEMAYDKLNNLLVCISSSGLNYYSVQAGLQPVGFVPLNDAKHISLLFNR